MSNVFFGIITAAIVAAACVFVYVMIEVRGVMKAIREFLKTTENTLNPTLEELRQSLKSTRQVTDNAMAITEDVRAISTSVREVSDTVMQVNRLVKTATAFSAMRVSGLRAAVTAAAEVIVKGFLSRRQKT